MTVLLKTFALAGSLSIALSASGFAQQDMNPSAAVATGADKSVTAQPVSYNGYSCDMVRAKVAEAGVTAAYAYARYMGLSHRDITRVRKACAV
jgi:hypothetical protein